VRIGSVALSVVLALAPMANAFAGQATPAAPAATPVDAKPAAPSEAVLKKGKELFNNNSCSSCHTLADAGAIGDIGPSLDKNDKLTTAFVIARVSSGSGPMPAFGGQMSADEIKTIAAYVTAVAQK
jgi:mono/diheme cytochrome c family protein